MKYPFHTAWLLIFLAGIIVTSIYDDVIYPMDDGLISIGMVLLFVVTRGTLTTRANRYEKRRKEKQKADTGPS